MHMCAIVTFIHAHIITKQTLACQAQAQIVVCQRGYKKAPASMAGIQIKRKGYKGENLKMHHCQEGWQKNVHSVQSVYYDKNGSETLYISFQFYMVNNISSVA